MNKDRIQQQRHLFLILIITEVLILSSILFYRSKPEKTYTPPAFSIVQQSILVGPVYAADVDPNGNPIPTGASSSNSASTNGQPIVLSLILRPNETDSYVMNTATAQAIGGGSITNPGGSTDPVNPDATCPGVGPVTCGTLAQGCHCSPDYNALVCGDGNTCSWCIAGQDSSKYAIDITNPLGGPAYVPKISVGGQAHTATCKGYADIPGDAEPHQSIKVLSCVDETTGDAVWMQFHHSMLSDTTVAGRSFKTGDVVAHSAPFEVLKSGPHVHFQIGIGGPCGSDMTGCRNANEFVQCN